MTKALRVFLLIGIASVGPSVLVMVLFKLCDPKAFNDGQFILAFILSVPSGLILGLGTGIAFVLAYQHSAKAAAWSLSIAGSIVFMLSLGMAWFSASSRGLTFNEFQSTIASPSCLSPLIFGAFALLVGLWIFYDGRPIKI